MKPSLLEIIAVISLACWGSVALPLSPCQALPSQPVEAQFSDAHGGFSAGFDAFGMIWEPKEDGRPDRRRGAGSR